MDADLWQEIGTALASPRAAGDPDGALARLTELWERCPPDEAALRCVIAHYAADLEEEPADELAWDERALVAWQASAEEDWHQIGIGDRLAMLPSLHLNLGDGHLRAGDREQARRHLAAADEHLDALADDGYGRMIRAGVAALADRCAGT